MVEECGVPAERAHWIPSGFDPGTYHSRNAEKQYNVVAVCGINRRRRSAFRALGWRIRRKRLVSGITGADCNELVNQSRVALNVHVSDGMDTETRLFELLPTSAAIVSEECDAPELFGDSGICWFPQGDWAAMRESVRALLLDEEWRNACVAKSQAIAPFHRWDARARAWTELLESLRCKSAAARR